MGHHVRTGRARRTRALVTNDDGVRSPGLAALTRAAVHVGIDVVVAAPSWDSSGASASLTAVEGSGRPLYEPCPLDGLDVSCFAVEAAPAYIVRAGLDGMFGPAPDLVLSGINRGLNTGRSVLHSGTVGAALTASSRGCRAAAFSIGSEGKSVHWSTASAVAEEVIVWLGKLANPVALNVNVPNVSEADLVSFRHARLARAGTVQTAVTELGSSEHKLTTDKMDGAADPDSDTALVAAGIACFSALNPICEDMTVDTSDLETTSFGLGPQN